MARRQLLLALLMLAPGDPSPGAQARWRVSERPVLILGAAESDTSQLFEVVAGATRLPDGKILVGDRDEYSLYLFAPDGRRLRSFGRKGGGPGELDYLARLWRCGDSVVTYDIAGHRASVFDLDGRFVRMFRFGSPETGAGVPYGSACNRRGLFVHLGWGDMRPTTPNNYWTVSEVVLVRSTAYLGGCPPHPRWWCPLPCERSWRRSRDRPGLRPAWCSAPG